MGSESKVHVGAYLQVPHVNKRIERTVLVCEAAEAHKVQRGDKFCRQCGSATEVRDASTVELAPMLPCHLPEVFVDHMFSPEYSSPPKGVQANIWLPNFKNSGGVILGEDSPAMELTSEYAQAQIAVFERTYADLLSYLRAQPGLENLQVKFGVVPFSW